MTITYSAVPSASQFQHDSSIFGAIRSKDQILRRIDWMLEAYDKCNRKKDDGMRRVVLCDLFQTCNYWLKSYYEKNPRMKKERYPAVHALFEAVVQQLAVLWQCQRAQVSRVIDEIYGRELHEYGVTVDEVKDKAKYLTKVERQVYRIRFKGGLAYQYPWWQSKSVKNLVLAESFRSYAKITRTQNGGNKSAGSVNYGGFAMTVERELFMGPHAVGQAPKSGFFHSSYTAGQRVLMAGTILIKSGVITAIRVDSGHYQPEDMNMAAFLWALRMFGVPLARIELFTFDNKPMGNALKFLRSHLNWNQYVRQRELELANRIQSDNVRLARGTPARHPHLQPRRPASTQAVGSATSHYN